MVLKNKASFLLGLIPITIWSLVASIVKYNTKPEEGLWVALYAVLFGSIFSIIFTIYKDKKYIKKNIDLILRSKKILLLLVGAAIFICGHYFSIYYVFSTSYVVQGNIINYMWPLFFFLLSKIFIYKKFDEGKTSDTLFIFMSFVGAILIISGDELSIEFISTPILLFLSILSAICASLYFLFTNILKDSLYGSVMFFSLPLVFAAFISLFFLNYLDVFTIARIEVMILGLILGLLSIFLGNTIWIISTSTNKSHAFSSIAYFIPVFSTFSVLYINQEPYNNYLFAGLILIVISNILIHSKKELVHAVNICFAILILYSGVCFLLSPIAEAKTNSFINITATLFAFFAAFLLNRIWNQKKDEEILLSDLFSHVTNVVNKLDIDIKEKQNIISEIKNKFIQNAHFNIYFYLTTLYEQYKQTIPNKTFKLIKKIHFIKLSAITLPELLILVLLGGVSVFYVVLYRDSSIMGDIMSIVFASSITYIIYIVYEFDKQGFLNSNKLHSLIEKLYIKHQPLSVNSLNITTKLLTSALLLCTVVIVYFIILKHFN